MMTGILTLAWLGLGGALASAGDGAETDEAAVISLNARMMTQMIVERSPDLFLSHAVDEFRVLAPGGLVEDRDAVVAGLAGWDVASITLTEQDAVRSGEIVTLVARLDIDGTMQPVGRWGPLKVMSTWRETEEGRWELLSRSLTPCLDRLVEIGRC